MIKKLFNVAFVLCACICPSIAAADSVWSVVGGDTVLFLDRPQLDRSGIDVTVPDQELLEIDDKFDRNTFTFEIDPNASMNLTESNGAISSMPLGGIRHTRSLMIRYNGTTVELHGLRIVPTDNDGIPGFAIHSGNKNLPGPMLLVLDARVGFDQMSDRMMIEAPALAITDELAAALGSVKLAGEIIGSIQVEGSSNWTGGDPASEPQDVIVPEAGDADPRGAVCGAATGPDVIVGEMHEIANYTAETVNSIFYDAFSVGTYSCNVGTSNLSWISGDSGGEGLHPVIGQNFYRLYTAADGATRFEQIGQSWLKHGFFALQNDLCCTCSGSGSGSALGVGCADPYSASRNGGQSGAGPKWQVNPSAGSHVHPISNPAGYSANTGRRLRIRETDLNQAGSLYFVEGQYVAKDDAASGNNNNNASYRAITVSGTSGSNRTFTLAGTTQRGEAGIRAWKDTDNTVTETDVQVPSDGLLILAAKATALGGGLYHYEYAIQNLNSHRGVKAFSIPVGTGATVSNIGFRDVDYHDNDGEAAVTRNGTDWTGAFSGGLVSWTMTDIGANSNALLWGTMYTFRFDCNRAPTTGNSTLTLFRTGSPASVTANTVIPSASGIIDCQPNGIADDVDISSGNSQDCNADGVPDECQSFTPCTLTLQSVVTGLSTPVGVYAPPGDTTRLFVVEQGGLIKIVNLPSYTVNATPYINLSALTTPGGERGLLGLAFHPDWATNGYFFVNYTNTAGNTVIARYQATGANPAATTGNPASAVILKTITQDFANHNGGCLQFGPDGMLYCGMGDGGSANDPNGRSQSDASLLGKMLRLDVNNPPTYVPATGNPGAPNLPEVIFKGLRNPWRFSFDRLTGDMYIADVGQDAQEEIDFVAAGSSGLKNFGWRCMEGLACTGLSGCTCNSAGLTLPIVTELHGDGEGTGSITGGYVYRGCDLPWLSGSYFYADYLGDYVKRFRYNGSVVSDTQIVQAPGGAATGLVSFGEDGNGELYAVSLLGTVYKIVCAAPPDLCGNGNLDAGEQCDDGNSVAGDGCFECQFENNDACADAAPITDGVHAFTTIGMTTDGPTEAGCQFDGQTYNDIWFDYTASCSGTLTVSTCEQLGGSAAYDSDLVLYTWDGTDCASRVRVACNDDDPVNACGGAAGGYHSTVSGAVTAGQHYLIRVGGYDSASSGTGNLLVSNSAGPCGVCGNGTVEAGEDCDPPGPNCSATCQFPNGDCNNNNVDDGVDIINGTSFDCNGNGDPDECEPVQGTTKQYVGSGAGYPAAIPDNNTTGVSRTITVPDSGAITDLNVALNITQTWNGDLVVTLTHAGTTVTLMNRPGGTGNADNGYNCTLDDEGTGGAIQTFVLAGDAGPVVSPPNYTPANPLSAFDTHNKNGAWTLNVSDRAASDTGNLVSWTLLFTNPGTPIPPCDCNGNGVTDSVDISQGTSANCNGNSLPDECDIASGAPDCDGGPTGNPTAGGNIINSFCFGCHGPNGFGVNCGGGSCPGPVLRNKTRTTISNKLLPPTDHPGGAFPGFTPQDFADIEAFLNDTGHPPARPDGVIDTCQTLSDCDADGVKDGCEFGAGTATDNNIDGIPDNCQAVLTGACCNAGACSIQTATACSTSGGTYRGDNTNCSPNLCPPANDNCANAVPIGDGPTPFSTVNATTDGPAEAGACTKFSDSQVNQDIWYIYTASCTGELTLSTCNAANYDTKIAVYNGITCPTSGGSAMACRDDVAGCAGNTTTLVVPVVQGNSYLIRVGAYLAATGTGTLTLTCNAYQCTGAAQCDDSDPCTADTCVNNVCVHTVIDSDNDGTPDCSDGCPNDPNKVAPGQCGCGVADTDTDVDGTADCNDGCPNDPNKIAPGACGCGVADTDTDVDGTPDCNDGCPNDPNKIAPGACGCGVADTDTDVDGTPDCNDGCPADPLKIAPGNCGCGVVDTAATGDMDGIGGPEGADIQLFTDAIIASSTDPADLCPGDFSANGVMDVGDVAGMVNALLSVP